MAKLYWYCDICGFEAENEDEKLNHLKDALKDPDHRIIYYDNLELEKRVRI